jgi:hypothetical protein
MNGQKTILRYCHFKQFGGHFDIGRPKYLVCFQNVTFLIIYIHKPSPKKYLVITKSDDARDRDPEFQTF